MTTKAASKWVDDRVAKMDLTGRDALRTHLITQEISIWFWQAARGEPIDDVTWLIQRRGFNEAEAVKVRALQAFFNDNSKTIQRLYVEGRPTLKAIPIKVAREIAEAYGCTQVVVWATNGMKQHVTTYGINPTECKEAASAGNQVKRAAGWPEKDIGPRRKGKEPQIEEHERKALPDEVLKKKD